MKYAVQWKCNRWVNYKDEKEQTLFFDDLEKAAAYAQEMKNEATCSAIAGYDGVRVVEVISARKYNAVQTF